MGIKDVLNKMKPQDQSCCSVKLKKKKKNEKEQQDNNIVTINLEVCKIYVLIK